MAELLVELYGARIGTLKGDRRTFDLVTAPAAVKAFGIDSPILSVAIPLALVPTRAHKQGRQVVLGRGAGQDRAGPDL